MAWAKRYHHQWEHCPETNYEGHISLQGLLLKVQHSRCTPDWAVYVTRRSCELTKVRAKWNPVTCFVEAGFHVAGMHRPPHEQRNDIPDGFVLFTHGAARYPEANCALRSKLDFAESNITISAYESSWVAMWFRRLRLPPRNESPARRALSSAMSGVETHWDHNDLIFRPDAEPPPRNELH
jgi:hypothetical protein